VKKEDPNYEELDDKGRPVINYEVIDDNHVLVNCGKCGSTGSINGINISQENKIIKKPCDACNGEGEAKLEVPFIETDVAIQLFKCNKCGGFGEGPSSEVEKKDDSIFSGSCVLCKGVGIISSYQLRGC
jgi:hypothetical protein